MLERTLKDKVAVITGAGPGIGRAVALLLASDGADLVLAARRPAPLEALAKEVQTATGRRALAIPTDIKDLDACAALIDRAAREFGRIDALVNNATHPFQRARVADYDWADYDGSVQLNVKGTMKLCGAASKVMAEKGEGGAIVNIGTLSTSALLPQNVAYTSTKAAMVAASKTMAREVGRDSIRVNVVTPGFTTGDDLDRLFENMAKAAGVTAEAMSQQVATRAELKRHVDPDDIAEAVLYLVSNRGRNVTGIELHVTAGALIT